jgi:hypothetical protein
MACYPNFVLFAMEGCSTFGRTTIFFAAINASLPRTAPSVTAEPRDLAAGTPHSTPSSTVRVRVRPSTYRGSAVDRARQREANLLAKMNSK